MEKLHKPVCSEKKTTVTVSDSVKSALGEKRMNAVGRICEKVRFKPRVEAWGKSMF